MGQSSTTLVFPTRAAARPAAVRVEDRRLPIFPSALIILLLVISVVGLPYYAAPLASRVRHPLHAWLRPSGYIGQTAGIIALAFFLVLWLYPLRKRFRSLSRTGPIARWLEVHVQLALPLPLLVAVHAGWRFDGLIGLGFWAMALVWASGIVGRYLYVRIPRSRAGVELSREEIAAERAGLLAELARHTGLDASLVERTLALQPLQHRLGPVAALLRLAADDMRRRQAARRLGQLAAKRTPGRARPSRKAIAQAVRLARREMALAQQARMLEATHALFRYWHVAHRPVAIAALGAVLLHVGVVVAVGATWFR
jgi:hypothetical protein